MLRAWGEYVCRHWDEPDEGIWEPRTGRTNHTHSRVLCWVALDRLLHLHAQDHVRWAPAAKFEENREAIRRQVESRAWNPGLGSYVAELDGDRVDATLLLLAWYGFEPAELRADAADLPADSRAARRGRRAPLPLSQRGAALRGCRRRGGSILTRRARARSASAASGVRSTWHWAAGAVEEAGSCSSGSAATPTMSGLFAEEIDPATGAALGNFPQAFTHVGLINAAISLARRLEGEAPMQRHVPPRQEAPETKQVRV